MPSAAAPETTTAAQLLEEILGTRELTSTSFEFWDGTRWPDSRERDATVLLRQPDALRQMFGPGTELGLAEAFMRGDFEVEGDLEQAFELTDLLRARPRPGWFSALRMMRQLRPRHPGRERSLGRQFVDGDAPLHSLRRDREAVSFHYDLSNAFYELWLDERMNYSCAYFTRGDEDIHEAQRAKLEHVCRKLRLQAGQRLLDIGCGWGGLALFAAEHFGVEVLGITLSRKQAEFATQRAAQAGLQGRVRIELRDYRELDEAAPFDAIVSVGMSEHVGGGQLPNYFARAVRVLKPGGVFLNHAIAESVRPRRRVGSSFMDAYVFPDTDIPPLPVLLQAAESSGLEVRDVENLREHYALTLRCWLRRLETRREAARMEISEATYRIWRLYLAGSAHGFARAQLGVYQVLLAKPDDTGAAHLPLTRADWYRA